MPKSKRPPPTGWSESTTPSGDTLLIYSIRGSKNQAIPLILGGGALGLGLWGLYWLLGAGGLTLAGYIFLLVPAGTALFGLYALDIALFATTTYRLAPGLFSADRRALFKSWRRDIPRARINRLFQQYTPPRASASHSNQGDWVTFLGYEEGGKAKDFPISEMSTPEEAKWVGKQLARWSGLPIGRGFGAGLEEADPSELPDLEDSEGKG